MKRRSGHGLSSEQAVAREVAAVVVEEGIEEHGDRRVRGSGEGRDNDPRGDRRVVGEHRGLSGARQPDVSRDRADGAVTCATQLCGSS